MALAGRLARRFFDDLRIGVELGSAVMLFSGAVSADARLIGWRNFSLYAGGRGVGVVGCGAGGGCDSWSGVGPTVALEMRFRTGAFMALEGGALYGDWDGTYEGAQDWVPLAGLRLGFPF